ncbi:MAG: coiled-coil domain-containing protein 60 [Alphaproteobacteria bacterium]|nr:coiled-coil domain-containing protein 60 [Alphaproteobacteria bacterium]
MTRPRRFLGRMGLFLAAVAIVAGVLFPMLRDAFLANPALNGLILGVLLIGIAFIFRQVLLLAPEAAWIDAFRQGLPGTSTQSPPRLLAPMAAMLGDRGRPVRLSAMALRSVLDGVGARLDEFRDISRYLIGLLIFLGLLGTFWGLLETVGAVSRVVGGLQVGGGELAQVFEELKRGLQAPLSGMGTAFSSSLFGLAGSLVLGFLDLQAGQAQNRFFNELEEWLSGQTRIGAAPSLAESEQPVPAYLQALIEQTADSLENLQRTLARGEENRRGVESSLLSLSERLSTLTDQMRSEQNLLVKLAESQMDMRPILGRLADGIAAGGFGLDDASRTHIRNLDVYMSRLLEETATGRAQIVQELRSEIKLLARTIAALAEDDAT